MSEFYSALKLARHVSDLIGSSSGAFFFFNKLYSQIWYVVIRVILNTSSRYEVVGRVLPTTLYQLDVSSSTRITTYQSANTACKTLLMMDR